MQGLSPVSYTHLDVYKRQDFEKNSKQQNLILAHADDIVLL